MNQQRPTVGLTRSATENASLASALASNGIDVVEIPTIEIVMTADNVLGLEQATAALNTFDWLVFTSANGVRSFDTVFRSTNTIESNPALANDHLKVAVVGPTTRAALTETVLGQRLADHEPSRIVESPVATAADLVASLPAATSPAQQVLAVLGEMADQTVTAGLTAKGYQVQRVDAYQNVRPEPVAEIPPLAAVAFFSPSAVDRFGDLYGTSWPAVCIGPRTAAQALHRGFDVAATASPHTEGGVVHELVQLFGNCS